MDSRRILFCFVTLFIYGLVTSQTAPATTARATSSTGSFNSTTETPKPVNQNCTTARSESGLCVMRRFCDYGTPGIDRSLYAPKSYVASCSTDTVCCPPKFIMDVTEAPEQQLDFAFDN